MSDVAVGVMVAFLHNFIKLLGAVWNRNNQAATLAQTCPRNYKSTLSSLGLNEDNFLEYIVCQKFDSIYDESYFIEAKSINSGNDSVKCSHIPFPNHPHQSRRGECSAALFKPVRVKGEKVNWHPKRIYCYQSLKESVSALINRPGFLQKCELWRTRTVPEDLMFDVYDGQIWDEFRHVDGKPFLAAPFNFALSLGCDWFQPFKHLSDSVGAIYLVVLNLPREERHKPENIILVGIIAGPHEPKGTMNSYLCPLVDELMNFWEGVDIACTIPMYPAHLIVRLALICVSCDIPATRKLCGFASHSASRGCSNCQKIFPSGVVENKLDFSGYERHDWEPRTHGLHLIHAKKYLEASTKSEQTKLVSSNGVRYSALLILPYFDIVRMHVVDPMHNLLLGTAKRMMEMWTTVDPQIITNTEFTHIHKVVSAIIVPKSVGRIPNTIGSSFAGFTADQWRNWTLIFSPLALKNIIPGNALNCWLMYVRACYILCARSISKTSVTTADLFLENFCKKFTELYGAQFCTINLHLHLHLKECIADYGPLYGWWCFAFERYNGMLGNYHTNNRNIEPQIMKKFLHHQQALRLDLPPEFACLLNSYTIPNTASGSLTLSTPHSTPERLVKLHHQSSSLMTTTNLNFIINTPATTQIPPIHENIMSQDTAEMLHSMYIFLYPNKRYIPITYTYKESARVCICEQVYGSQKAYSNKACVIIANWPNSCQKDQSSVCVGLIKHL